MSNVPTIMYEGCCGAAERVAEIARTAGDRFTVDFLRCDGLPLEVVVSVAAEQPLRRFAWYSIVPHRDRVRVQYSEV